MVDWWAGGFHHGELGFGTPPRQSWVRWVDARRCLMSVRPRTRLCHASDGSVAIGRFSDCLEGKRIDVLRLVRTSHSG